jgi:hypothetical protein
MKVVALFVLTVVAAFAQQVAPAQAAGHIFVEGGASELSTAELGVGGSLDVLAGQQIFGEVALVGGHTGEILIGAKVNVPAIKKYQPFLIFAYGASFEQVPKLGKAVSISTLGPSLANDVSNLGIAAGFAQRYGVGLQRSFGKFTFGLGASLDRSGTDGFRAWPFLFVSR